MNKHYVDGDYRVLNVQYGQKEPYGDSYFEYEVYSDRPIEEVEEYCRTKIYRAMPYDEWLEIYRSKDNTMDHAFTPHYNFNEMSKGSYFYQVRRLYTD